MLVVPTYAWRIPRIVEKWLEHTSLTGSQDFYTVMTCGGQIGNAGKYVEKLCIKKGMNGCGRMEIVMPENYIALFSTPTKEQAEQIIKQAREKIFLAADFIREGKKFPRPNISLGEKISSGAINDLFYPIFVHDKKFYATDACISCGICVTVCRAIPAQKRNSAAAQMLFLLFPLRRLCPMGSGTGALFPHHQAVAVGGEHKA